MKFRDFEPSHNERWNAFVEAHPDGTFFHRAEWALIAGEAFGFKPIYRFAERDGEIVAVLPLSHVRRRLFGDALISSPLCVYGGAIGEPEAAGLLEQQAIAQGHALNVNFVEFRKQPSSEMLSTENTGTTISASARFRKTLPENPDDVITAIPRKQRAEVRRAMKMKLSVWEDSDPSQFYSIYANSVHRLGTPIFAKRYVDLLLHVFSNQCRIFTVGAEQEPIASVLAFFFRDEVLPYYGGALPESRKMGGYPFLYFSLMHKAAREGIRWYDFGRSQTGSGAYAFKKNFGFDPEPLHYQFHLVQAKDAPDMNPDSTRNKLITSTWSRLPLSLANRLGPFVYPAVV